MTRRHECIFRGGTTALAVLSFAVLLVPGALCSCADASIDPSTSDHPATPDAANGDARFVETTDAAGVDAESAEGGHVDATTSDAGGSDGGAADAGGSDAGAIDAAGLLNCAAHPSVCGFPDETNTGVPASVTLTPSQRITVTQDGTVISGLDISGGIDINANNVTIRNVRVTGGGEADFLVAIRGINTLIEDSTIAGKDSGTNGVSMGIFDLSGGKGTTLRRLNMYSCAECINGPSELIEDNYIHDLAVWSGSGGVTHDEDIYIPCGNQHTITIRHNTLFNQVDQTATIYNDPYQHACANLTIEGNLLAGGGWTFYLASGNQRGSGYSFAKNRFSRLFFPNGGHWGPLTGTRTAADTGNIWDDTGAPL